MTETRDLLEQEAVLLAKREYIREQVARFRADKSKDQAVRNKFFRKQAIERGFIQPAPDQDDSK